MAPAGLFTFAMVLGGASALRAHRSCSSVPIVYRCGTMTQLPAWTLPLAQETALRNPGTPVYVAGCWGPGSETAAAIAQHGLISLGLEGKDACRSDWLKEHLRPPSREPKATQFMWQSGEMILATALEVVLGPHCASKSGKGAGCLALTLDPDVLFLASAQHLCDFYEAEAYDAVVPDGEKTTYYSRHATFLSLRAMRTAAHFLTTADQGQIDAMSFAPSTSEVYPIDMMMPHVFVRQGLDILWQQDHIHGQRCPAATGYRCLPWRRTSRGRLVFTVTDQMLFRGQGICGMDVECVSPRDYGLGNGMLGELITPRLELRGGLAYFRTGSSWDTAVRVRLASIHFAELAKQIAKPFVEALRRTETSRPEIYPDFLRK